ncbi:MAG: hypothetical protein ACI3VN_01735 [Candidatus Onthomonas sp.]
MTIDDFTPVSVKYHKAAPDAKCGTPGKVANISPFLPCTGERAVLQCTQWGKGQKGYEATIAIYCIINPLPCQDDFANLSDFCSGFSFSALRRRDGPEIGRCPVFWWDGGDGNGECNMQIGANGENAGSGGVSVKDILKRPTRYGGRREKRGVTPDKYGYLFLDRKAMYVLR